MPKGRMGLLFDDMRQLEGHSERVELLRELLLPRGHELLRHYGKTNRWWLPVLYLRRLGRGLSERT